MCANRDFSELHPLGHTREYFLRALELVIEAGLPESVRVAGLGPVGEPGGIQNMGVLDMPRLNILLEGRREMAMVSTDPQARAEKQWTEAGQAEFFPAYAPYSTSWETAFFGIGLVWLEKYVRLVAFDHLGGPRLLARSPFVYHTTEPLGERGRHLLAAMATLAGSPLPPDEALSLVHLLLKETRRHVAAYAGRPSANSKAARTWFHAERYLDQHLHRPTSREQVAEAAGVTGSYLSRLCLRQTGRSFQRHLQHLRLERAQQLLGNTGLKVQEIALVSGFANARHFNDLFRREIGVAPGKWRLQS